MSEYQNEEVNKHQGSRAREQTSTNQATAPLGGHTRTLQDSPCCPGEAWDCPSPCPALVGFGGRQHGRVVTPGQDLLAWRSGASQAPLSFWPKGQTAWGPRPGSPAVSAGLTPGAEGGQVPSHSLTGASLPSALPTPHSFQASNPKAPRVVLPTPGSRL